MAASHGVCGLGECVAGLESHLTQLGGVDVRGRGHQQVVGLSGDGAFQAAQNVFG